MAEPERVDLRADAEAAVLAFLKRPDYRPISLREMLRQMHVPKDVRATVRRVTRDLLREGRIAKTRDNRLTAAASGGVVRGRFVGNPRGFGFVQPLEGGPDLFIPPRKLGGAMHGDVVAARVTKEGKAGEREGEVVEILDRRGRRVFGVFRALDRAGVVEPFDPELGMPVAIPGAFRRDARDGDAVGVELLRTVPGGGTEGKVVEVLGRMGAPGVDALVVARRHGLALEFPEEVIEASAELPEAVPPEEAGKRERFDDPPTVTIDGETAKDFDDAISVQDLPGGGYRLFVHIADVAWFVGVDDALDREARARGTSVYFPDKVLPMFPEALSNHLCSLRPHEDRLVQSVILDLDPVGEVRAVRFADGVIRSAARLTYTLVAEFLDGARRHEGFPRGVGPMLEAADRLREVLESRRRARGSIDLDLPEPKILLDVEGAMTGVTVEMRNKAHRMIEEFMLAANEAVAGHLARHDAPCMYRIHETPDPMKMEALAEFARGFGLDLRLRKDGARSHDIQRLLDAADGKPEHRVIAQVALRSMKQARYAVENVGHFGLAAPVYAHFTSPIRRYPDLVVHRMLRALRRHRRDALTRLAHDLDALAQQCSKLERAAEAAERELLEWKKIEFMKGKEGEIFPGLVTGVARFGLFVQLADSLVEGLVRAENLGDERFEFVESRHEMRGSRSGKTFGLGDTIDVRVQRVDTVLRRVDLGLASSEAAPSQAPEGRRRRPAGAPTATPRAAPRKRGSSARSAPRSGGRGRR